MGTVIFWLISFPSPNGPLLEYSPRYILTGKELSYKHHAVLEFGEYVQTHEQHTNNMNSQTLGVIYLGLTGNAQGTHYFLSLATGETITQTCWTCLPMPLEVIQRVNQLGRNQNMKKTITFVDRHGMEIEDNE